MAKMAAISKAFMLPVVLLGTNLDTGLKQPHSLEDNCQLSCALLKIIVFGGLYFVALFAAYNMC